MVRGDGEGGGGRRIGGRRIGNGNGNGNGNESGVWKSCSLIADLLYSVLDCC